MLYNQTTIFLYTIDYRLNYPVNLRKNVRIIWRITGTRKC